MSATDRRAYTAEEMRAQAKFAGLLVDDETASMLRYAAELVEREAKMREELDDQRKLIEEWLEWSKVARPILERAITGRAEP